MNTEELFNIELGVVADYISTLKKNSSKQSALLNKYNAINADHYKEMLNAHDEALKDEINTKYTNELTKLVKSKDIYYDRLLIVSKFIISSYTKELIPENRIQDYVEFYTENLANVKNMGNTDILFRAILIIILNELFYYDNSEVLDYIYTNEVLMSYLNEAIILALERYKYEDDLSEILENIEVSDYGYINMDIFNYLIKKNNLYTSKVNAEANKMYNEVEEAEKSIEELNVVKEKYYHVKKKINKEASALALTAILSTATFLLGYVVVKRSHDKLAYETSIETLDESGELVLSDGYLDKIDGGTATYVVEYTPWERVNNGFTRDAKSYDVTYIGYNDLAGYLLLDFEALGIIPDNFTESKELLMPEDLYESDITIVSRLNQENNAKTIHTEEEYSNAEQIGLSLSIVVLVTCAIFSITKKALNIRELRNTILNNEFAYKELKSDIMMILDQYKNCNRNIEELKDTFYKFCQKYEYLITDTNVLSKYNVMKLERKNNDR